MEVNTVCKAFNSLTPIEIYRILQLRSVVFVVEQQCIFLDPDGKDEHCKHVMVQSSSGSMLGCSRLVPPGLIYKEMSIGRVVTHPDARRNGLGKLLMQTSLDHIYEHFGHHPIKIGAQFYLKEFYKSFGFSQIGEIYDEDGIDHIHMIKD